MATVKEERRYGKGSSETFSDLEMGIARMGKILNDDPDSLSVEGKIKYGLGATTKVKAQVQPEGDVSIIAFESKGGDFAGKAARSNVERLLETMTKVDDVDFDAKKADKNQWLRVGYFALGAVGVGVLLLILLYSDWFAESPAFYIGVTVFLAAVYMWGWRKITK